MVAIRSPAFGFGWDDDTPWGEGVSADKSGVEGGAINSRRCVRGMWGSMGRIGMAGVGSASERRSAYILVLLIRLVSQGFFQLGMGEILLKSSKYLLY